MKPLNEISKPGGEVQETVVPWWNDALLIQINHRRRRGDYPLAPNRLTESVARPLGRWFFPEMWCRV